MNYRDAIDWLYSTQMFGIKLGLENPTRLLRDFLAFPKHTTKVIHVAGTNGKGSTCAIIDSLARGLAVRSGLFTSPHLIDYRERVRVNGIEITEEKTAALLSELRELVADWEHHPTFFELTLALAMRHFRDCECELIVLETGMGGRLDATTAVPADVCVLTPIALDHTKWLGSTLTEIAEEKAGIVVNRKPLLSSDQEPEARLAIERAANQAQAPLTFITEPLLGYTINLPGEHQKRNASLACEAMISCGYSLNYEIVHTALGKVQWPGRFESVGQYLTLDAAHNPHAAQALVNTWTFEFPGKKAQIIFGAVEDKNVEAVLTIISPIAEHFHFVPVNSARGLPPESFQADLPSTVYESVADALKVVTRMEAPALITGSLFLLGQAKALLNNQETRSSSQ
ncbi:Mur ligase family protein [Akkermansiaceae bacterium]|nr:Mur ligase family protein [Akkermansiaceae bacterium]MDA7888835.1 Mur ligase family protein [Akkermansiaceae bacterium]MDB4544670.1 Mur ligase family protein [Akkermansiaceae bacterium]